MGGMSARSVTSLEINREADYVGYGSTLGLQFGATE